MYSSQREHWQEAILDGSASTVITIDLVATLELKLTYFRLRARESHLVAVYTAATCILELSCICHC
jgi:hypothetical protein